MADQDPGGISPLQQMVASGAGAVVTSLFMTPLDVVKVRLQSQRPSVTSELMPSSRLWSLSYAKCECPKPQEPVSVRGGSVPISPGHLWAPQPWTSICFQVLSASLLSCTRTST